MFENFEGQTPDAGVTGILIAHLEAFGSGELKSKQIFCLHMVLLYLVLTLRAKA